MMKMNRTRDQLLMALMARGESIVKIQGDYWMTTRKAGGYWFLGRNGALRYGKNKSQSKSATDSPFYKELFGPAPNLDHF